MVWGAFCSRGMLRLVFLTTHMNSTKYIEVLEQSLVPFLEENSDLDLTFQHDNASVHKSCETSNWLSSNQIVVMDWPACFPDQNPIENIWGTLVWMVYSEKQQYDSMDMVKLAIISCWNQISDIMHQNLIQSIPSHIFELIKQNGGITRY